MKVFAGIFLLLAALTPGNIRANDAPPGGHSDLAAEPPSLGVMLNNLTLEEKVGQLFIIYHGPPKFMAEHGFGGSLVFESMLKTPEDLHSSLAAARELCKIPLLVAIDQEGGQINRLRPLFGLASTPGAEEMAGWSAEQISTELEPWASAMTDLGINTNLAPVVDPAVDSLGQPTLMGQRGRAFGSSTEDITRPAGAFAAAFASHNIGCIIKHFPGYNVPQNSDHELAVSSADEAVIEEQIVAFTLVMDQALGVMMSSIRFTAVSAMPAVLDAGWVSRARCGHNDRLVMTDDLWGGALRAWVSGTESVHATDYPPEDLRRLVLLAFDAGNDMLMVTYPKKAVEMKAILTEEIRGDPQRLARLDSSVRRILRAKLDLGLWTD